MTKVGAFVKSYRSSAQDGEYAVTWMAHLDLVLHKTLARAAHMTYAAAHTLEIKSATLVVNSGTLLQLLDPDGLVDVQFKFRINKIPATFTAQLPFYTSDIDTLEKINAPAPSVSC